MDALKNWILAGREGFVACLSPETLKRVRLDKSPVFVWMSRPKSCFYNFFYKCLNVRNPYVVYVQSINRAFLSLDLNGAIQMLVGVKDIYPLAELLFIMLNSCAGHEDMVVFNKFKKEHYRLREVQQMSEALIYNIKRLNPRRCSTFEKTWQFKDYPEC